MKFIAIGVGSYGISIITTISNSNAFENVIAIDSDRNALYELDIEKKIFISKRLPVYEAVDRIKNKLKRAITDCDIVFVVSNPIDLPYPYVLPQIIDYIKSLGFLVIALVVEPYGRYERKRLMQAKQTVETLLAQTATIRILQKNIQHYCKPNYKWYDYYISSWNTRDKILEQVDFDKWYKNSGYQEQHIKNDILVGVFYLQRTLDLLNLEYPCATKEDVLRILLIPGVVHLASAISLRITTQKEQIGMIQARASFNDINKTSTHGSNGLLFVIDVSERTSKEAVGEICYMLHTFCHENTYSAFTINLKKTDSKDISVRLLATGADDMNKQD